MKGGLSKGPCVTAKKKNTQRYGPSSALAHSELQPKKAHVSEKKKPLSRALQRRWTSGVKPFGQAHEILGKKQACRCRPPWPEAADICNPRGFNKLLPGKLQTTFSLLV